MELKDVYIVKTNNLSKSYNKNFDYPEKPLKYKHIRRISD